LLTLYTTPVIYLYMERLVSFMAAIRARAFQLKTAPQQMPAE
jgi:hypothetical protein